MSKRNIFISSIVVGFMFWTVFTWFNIEPWDSPYGWIIVGILGLSFGFIGKGSPWLWPIGIFLGEVLFGLGSFMKSLFFYSGGGANMFIPLGILFLIPFSIPAFVGSFVGFGIKKATMSLNNTLQPTQKPRD
jgi:hypothetical protein